MPLARAVHNILVYVQWEMARMHNEPTYTSALLAIATARDPEFRLVKKIFNPYSAEFLKID